MSSWKVVNGVRDGDPVSEDTFNKPIAELVSRTEWLKDRVDGLSDESSISVQDVRLADGEDFSVGDIVSIDPATGLYAKAIASMSLYDAYTASEKAFAVGMLTKVTGSIGTVVLYGKVDISGIDVDGMVDQYSKPFENGQYYLSSTTPGKITRFPTGPRIMLGFFSAKAAVSGSHFGNIAMLNPQHMDIEAHSHRTFRLAARPAGTIEYEYEDGNESNDKIVGFTLSGYAPSEDVEGAPRMVICGDWTTDLVSEYTVVLDNGSGGTPTSWPCTLKWTGTADDSNSGSAQVNFFGEEISIGKFGLAVKFVPGKGMAIDKPFAEDVEEASRTWTASRELGRGWVSAAQDSYVDAGGGTIALSGVPSAPIKHVGVDVPEYIFSLTDSIQSITAGDILSIEGEEFVFVEEGYSYSGDATEVYIAGSPYDTFVAVAEKSKAVLVYDDPSEQVVACTGTADVSFNGASLSPVLSGGGYAVVYDTSTMSSIAVPQDIGLTSLPVVGMSLFSEVPLVNGMRVSFVGETLPAVGTSAVLDVSASAGAAFRYAIEFDNDLKKHFPPVPARSGSLMLNGVELESAEHFGSRAVYSIGNDSLYWLDPEYGCSPWAPEGAEEEYRLLFHFVSEFHSETGPVTSLRSAADSPIKVYRCGTDEEASVGDLALDLKLELDASDNNESGYKVVKRTRNGRLLLGPVVEKIVAGPGIAISKAANTPEGQGVVAISADGTEYNGSFETIALENAKIESIGMFPYVRMLKWDPSSSNIQTGFVAKFHVPATAYVTMYRVKFYATVFGEESFSGQSSPMYAGVRMNYNILPDFGSSMALPDVSNLKDGLISPDSQTTINIPFGIQTENGYGYSAFDPMLVHNDSDIPNEFGRSYQVYPYAFPTNEDCSIYCTNHGIVGSFGVLPGYTVAVRFSRASTTEAAAYAAPIGFLNLRWSLEAVTAGKTGELVFTTDEIINNTVLRLRNVALNAGSMNKDYDVVDVLQKLLAALKGN